MRANTPTKGMGEAVFQRTIQRDGETWAQTAQRTAWGNTTLHPMTAMHDFDKMRAYIEAGALLMSGRHLQHGDGLQVKGSQERFTNCSTAALSSVMLELLLAGSGVGRSYDDDMMLIDYRKAPQIALYLDPFHDDFDSVVASKEIREYLLNDEADLNFYWQKANDYALHQLESPTTPYNEARVLVLQLEDSIEGWAKAAEVYEVSAYKDLYDIIVYDFSRIRKLGSPIRGMQNKPAPGPKPLMYAFAMIAQRVLQAIEENWSPWKLCMFVDHYLAEAVVSGGARRSARIAVKNWQDADIFEYISIKHDYLDEYGYPILWSANNSVGVDETFWLTAGIEGSRANLILKAVTKAQYQHKKGEPALINLHKLNCNREGLEEALTGAYVGSEKFQLGTGALEIVAKLIEICMVKPYPFIVNPCGEIVLFIVSGFCVIADYAPYFCDTLEEVLEGVVVGVRALMRANLMPSMYRREVDRTNRIGLGITGIHEFAWKFWGLTFRELLTSAADEFWAFIAKMSDLAVKTADEYADELGVTRPHTVLTIKPSGTVSKLFLLSEGAHLPAFLALVRWVQFNKTADAARIEAFRAAGFEVKDLTTYPNMVIVGFPTLPEICKIMPVEKVVTAYDATPDEQFEYLRRLEKHWLDGSGHGRGNQVSYTLKFDPDKIGYDDYHSMILNQMPTVKTCSVLPFTDGGSYEYLPEESISYERYLELVARTGGAELTEDIDMNHLQCAAGICPI